VCGPLLIHHRPVWSHAWSRGLDPFPPLTRHSTLNVAREKFAMDAMETSSVCRQCNCDSRNVLFLRVVVIRCFSLVSDAAAVTYEIFHFLFF